MITVLNETGETAGSVLVVGAGPVGCALAVLLRRQGVHVRLLERGRDRDRSGLGQSFNLTLTERGLRGLPRSVQRRLYLQGAVLGKRIIHHRGGSISTQPYGTSDRHHLLSIPRETLQELLRDQAERAGARIIYDTECLEVDTARPAVRVRDSSGRTRWMTADLVVGCDGAGSAVRESIAATHSGDLTVRRRDVALGHAEITMNYQGADPGGMHLWPRGDHFLQAQPNRDGTFTTSLFKPLAADRGSRHFAQLDEPRAVTDYCALEFADVARRMQEVETELTARLPGRLRLVGVAPYHHRRVVLAGDAAHTVVPFLGQGINCSFEDVATLASAVERHRRSGRLADTAAAVAAEFSAVRVGPGHALAELSLDNLRELTRRVDDPRFLQRRALERRLHELHPDLFSPLYQMVAFSQIPYDEARRTAREAAEVLDALCAGRDLLADRDWIIGAYVRQQAASALTGAHR